MPKAIVVVGAILALLVVSLAVFGALTYPRTSLAIPVSFTIGADVISRQFSQPVLCDKVQVQVSVSSGAALWNAQILNGSQVIWEHSKGQGEQTSYESGWLTLPSGSYNFTFRTLGIGSLNAQVTVSSKGGLW